MKFLKVQLYSTIHYVFHGQFKNLTSVQSDIFTSIHGDAISLQSSGTGSAYGRRVSVAVVPDAWGCGEGARVLGGAPGGSRETDSSWL